MSMIEKVNELKNKKQEASLGGGQLRIEAQKAKGKLTAIERIHKLFDEGSFVETDAFTQSRSVDFDMASKRKAGDGVICGYGRINGRPVFVASQDYTVLHGSVGEMHAKKITKTIDMAVKTGVPMVYLFDSDGARIEEGTDVLEAIGEFMAKQTMASGVIPQISAILGNCAGISSLAPTLSDFVLMTEKTSYMYMNGPAVIESSTGVNPGKDDIGSALTHTSLSGNAHIYYENEDKCILGIKDILSYLPDNNLSEVAKVECNDDPGRASNDIYEVISDSYDMKDVITKVTDNSRFMEIQPEFGQGIVIGFARLNGDSVGIVANNPAVNQGALDMDSADKAARFIRLLDSFNIPILTFTHTSGYIADAQQEKKGLIRHVAKMLYAFAEASVPKINVVTGKAIGGAFIAMNSKSIGADVVYAYPTTEISIMESEAAANVIFSKQIAQSEDPTTFRKEKVDEYRQRYGLAYEAANRGYVDDVIDPAYTRTYVISALEMLKSKREDRPNKKHGNMPL